MCGRFVRAADRSAISTAFDASPVPDLPELQPDFNVAPTKHSYLVVAGSERTGHRRELVVARWGLVPSWAKDSSIGNRMINARAETAASKPSFRSAFKKRRVIVPADGYYEWYRPTGNGGRSSPKQPYFIHPSDGQYMAMAGLCELWRDPAVLDDDAPGAWLRTYTILTCPANERLRFIHDRMPVMIRSDEWDSWLDPHLPDPRLDEWAVRDSAALQALPVSTAVNNVRHNGPELITPIELDG